MLLVNKQKLEVTAALKDESHPLHDQAVFYSKQTQYLRDTYGRYMRFIDIKRPKYCKGADSKGREIPKLKEPDTIMRVPLERYYSDPKRGREVWSCCLTQPKRLDHDQWDVSGERAVTIKGDKIIDLDTDIDLAFYLTFISPFVKKKLLKIENPAEDALKEGERNRELTRRKVAIWNMTDDDKIKTMAAAYGVTQTNTKTPDRIRLDLEKILEVNDRLKKGDPTVRGTIDFMDEMGVTDGLILRAFVQNAIDDKKLEFKGDGKWRIGDNIIFHVSYADIERKRQFDALCNYLNAPNNKDKLEDFLKALVDKEYLTSVTDKKVYAWLAKSVGINIVAKKPVFIKNSVHEYFCGGEAPFSEEDEE